MSAAEGVVATTSLEWSIANYQQQFFPNGHLPGRLKSFLASTEKEISEGIFTLQE